MTELFIIVRIFQYSFIVISCYVILNIFIAIMTESFKLSTEELKKKNQNQSLNIENTHLLLKGIFYIYMSIIFFSKNNFKETISKKESKQELLNQILILQNKINELINKLKEEEWWLFILFFLFNKYMFF